MAAGASGPVRDGGDDEPARLPVDLTDEAQAELAERAAPRHDWIGKAGRPDRDADERRLPADGRLPRQHHRPRCHPDAAGDGRTHLGYQDHYVVDGGKARIILAALVAPAEVQENQPALDLLWRTRFRWKLRPRQVTGDTKYGTVENIVAIEDQRIRAYVPLSDVGRGPGMFGDHDFVYDAAADTYRCPGGADVALPLPLPDHAAAHLRSTSRRPARLRAPGPVHHLQRGRRVGRSLDEAYLDRVRGYHATEPFAKAMRKRQVWVEPLFAEAKDWHGLRRFRLRGLEKVNGEALLIAAGQNLKRLLSRRGWGRRPFPSGAAGIVLPALLSMPALMH